MAGSGASPRSRSRHRIALVVGSVVLAAMLWWSAPWHGANPVTLAGVADPNGDATAIGFVADSRFEARRWGLSPEGEGFVVAGVMWTDHDGTLHSGGGSPGCLTAGETTRVELSFARIRYLGDGGGPTRVVTSLDCRG